MNDLRAAELAGYYRSAVRPVTRTMKSRVGRQVSGSKLGGEITDQANFVDRRMRRSPRCQARV
jgi:hypothetical protein